MEPDAVVISVAAGVTIATMEALLPPSVAVLRAMPNTPALVGRGVTGLAAGGRASAADLAMARTAVRDGRGRARGAGVHDRRGRARSPGPGPAYVFYLIEQLTRAAVGLGLHSRAGVADGRATRSSARPSCLPRPAESPQELRRRVTSPHGTTERAIAEMEKADLGANVRPRNGIRARPREGTGGRDVGAGSRDRR